MISVLVLSYLLVLMKNTKTPKRYYHLLGLVEVVCVLFVEVYLYSIDFFLFNRRVS